MSRTLKENRGNLSPETGITAVHNTVIVTAIGVAAVGHAGGTCRAVHTEMTRDGGQIAGHSATNQSVGSGMTMHGRAREEGAEGGHVTGVLGKGTGGRGGGGQKGKV